MRFSSLVSLLVVTASLALGGCAADAESASSDPSTSAAALTGIGSPSVDKTGKHSNEAALADQAVRAVDRGHAVNSELTAKVGIETGLAASTELTAKVGVIAGRAANSELTDTVGVIAGRAANAEFTDTVGINAGRAANPGELVTVGPEFGAHLPDQQAHSRSGQAHLTTSTSSAHADEP